MTLGKNGPGNGRVRSAGAAGHGSPSRSREHAAPTAATPEPCAPSLLVVDDDGQQRMLLVHLLRGQGYTVRDAADGPMALREAGRSPPDIVLLDVDMPGMDGFAVARVLLSRCRPEPAVLFVSAHADPRYEVHGVELGGLDYITKPYDADVLAAKVRGAARLRQNMEALRLQALVDPLTGLLNRAELEARGRELCALSERSRRPFCCVVVDVDQFKQVNDTNGHAVGDAALVEVARRLRAVSRASDAVFRLGGEEFLLLAPDTSASAGAILAERARAAVADTPMDADSAEGALRLTVSAGVAAWCPGRRLEDVLAAADRALYAAKASGRDRVEIEPA